MSFRPTIIGFDHGKINSQFPKVEKLLERELTAGMKVQIELLPRDIEDIENGRMGRFKRADAAGIRKIIYLVRARGAELIPIESSHFSRLQKSTIDSDGHVLDKDNFDLVRVTRSIRFARLAQTAHFTLVGGLHSHDAEHFAPELNLRYIHFTPRSSSFPSISAAVLRRLKESEHVMTM